MGSARKAAVFHQRQIRDNAERDGERANEQKLKPRVISAPIIETDFTQLEDGSLVEMIEDPENPSKTVFAMFKDGEIRFVDHVQSGGRILKPIPRDEEILKHIPLPKGVRPYDSVAAILWQMNDAVFSRCLDLEDDYKFLLACFVLSTWFIDCDRMPVAPYIALVGLPASGKSTVLKLLRLLCRRGLLTADISPAALYRACNRLTPTLLIDETGTAGNTRDLFHLLRTGNSRELVALRKDQSFKAYGAKVVAWNKLPSNDSALNSRCVTIPMQETNRLDLLRPSDPAIIAAADDIQERLLRYRLEKFEEFKATALPMMSGDERLFARSRDLYQALALACHEDTHYRKWLRRCLEVQQQSSREPLPRVEAAVLQTIYRMIHFPFPGKESLVAINNLTAEVNGDLKDAGEHLQLSPRAVGAALSSLGIANRKRTNLGWQIWIDLELRKRIHELIERYGIDKEHYLPYQVACKMCDFCDPSKDLRNYRFSGPWERPSTPQLHLPFQKAEQPKTTIARDVNVP